MNQKGNRPISRSWALAGALLGLTLGAQALAHGDGSDGKYRHGNRACTQTAIAAKKACGNDITNDYWLAIGECRNLSDPSGFKDCAEEAKSDFADGRQLCADQLDARRNVCALLGEAPYDPDFSAADFPDDPSKLTWSEANPYFPLVPGTKWFYVVRDSDGNATGETDTVTITDEVREIAGVPCITSTDTVKEDGEVTEATTDWYAQDKDGNVWYCGESSREFEDGVLVSIEGSWQSGVDNGKPGIIMKAQPQPGDAYRQEFQLGNAEDVAKVSGINGSAMVPAANCTDTCVVTDEFTPLEPDALETKYYASDVGDVLEIDHQTGVRTELTQFSPGSP
jgi:hypothetical protein